MEPSMTKLPADRGTRRAHALPRLCAALLAIAATSALAGELSVDFASGSFGELERFLGPSDNPRDRKPEFTVIVEGGRALHLAPATAPGPRLTGFLEPPARLSRYRRISRSSGCCPTCASCARSLPVAAWRL
jgi:hypothetical protein